MTRSNCDCTVNCTGIALVAGITVGILAAVFRYIGLITVTPAFLWVTFGVAVGLLGITLLSGIPNSPCQCRSLTPYLIGILGTVLTSVVLLGITFAATSIIGAIITGALLFFFAFMLISATCLISCRCE